MKFLPVFMKFKAKQNVNEGLLNLSIASGFLLIMIQNS